MAVDEENDDDTQTNNEYHDVPADDNDKNEDEDQDIEDEEDTEDDEDEDDNDDEIEEVLYPDVVSKDALIKNLTDYFFIDHLICEFSEDENWDDTKNLRRTLLCYREQIRRFSFHNNYDDNKDMRRKCFNFFLEYLTKYSETPDMIHGSIEYNIPYSSSMTLEEAQRLASAIKLFDSEQSKHVALVLSGDSGFTERGTFACIFNSIVDNGTLEDFTVWTIRSIVDLEHGCIGRSNLATNTTLKQLSFQHFGNEEDFDNVGMVTVVDGAMRELACALQQNTGLQSIDLDARMLTNHGRRALLDSLRDNCTLTALATQSAISGNRSAACVGVCTCSPSCDSVSYEIQSEIDDHMKLNKCWTRIQNFPYMDMKTKKGVPKQMPKRIQTISVQIYPDVIEVLAKKPLLLYKFLRNDIDHTLLFGDVGKPPRRRRSARVRKKRRLIGPSSWHSILKSNILRK